MIVFKRALDKTTDRVAGPPEKRIRVDQNGIAVASVVKGKKGSGKRK